MKTVSASKAPTSPLILSARDEEILLMIWQFRFVTALEVAHMFFSPKSLTHVKERLSRLAGLKYLYRFSLLTTRGNKRIFTLGSRGRDLLNGLGFPVDWHFRPYKVGHLSHSHVLHDLILSRLIIAAHYWSRKNPTFKLSQARLCYELARNPMGKVIPDAWMNFEILKNGEHEHYLPIMLEIDRGTESRQKFQAHLRSRIEFIRSGQFRKWFGQPAIRIAYATTGQFPEYRSARLRALCAWTTEVLAELGLLEKNWASVFRLASLVFEEMYDLAIFTEPVWFRPDKPTPELLLTP